MPRVGNPEEARVLVIDWYIPHNTEEAFDFAERLVLSPTLLIGGGCTEMAVCYNKPHRWLAGGYKELEFDHSCPCG